MILLLILLLSLCSYNVFLFVVAIESRDELPKCEKLISKILKQEIIQNVKNYNSNI